MLLTRRSLFGGVAAILAAPAIVRVSSLMPVKVLADPNLVEMRPLLIERTCQWVGFVWHTSNPPDDDSWVKRRFLQEDHWDAARAA